MAKRVQVQRVGLPGIPRARVSYPKNKTERLGFRVPIAPAIALELRTDYRASHKLGERDEGLVHPAIKFIKDHPRYGKIEEHDVRLRIALMLVRCGVEIV